MQVNIPYHGSYGYVNSAPNVWCAGLRASSALWTRMNRTDLWLPRDVLEGVLYKFQSLNTGGFPFWELTYAILRQGTSSSKVPFSADILFEEGQCLENYFTLKPLRYFWRRRPPWLAVRAWQIVVSSTFHRFTAWPFVCLMCWGFHWSIRSLWPIF